MKIGRNDPCHCGSGLKYKKCCIEKDKQAAAEQLAPVGDTSATAAVAAPAAAAPRPRAPLPAQGGMPPRKGPPPPRPNAIRKRAV